MAAPSADEMMSLAAEDILSEILPDVDVEVESLLAADDSPLEMLDESAESPKMLHELEGFGSHIALGQASERELLSEAMKAVGGLDEVMEKKQSRQALLQARKDHMLRSSIHHAVNLRAERDFQNRASAALRQNIIERNDSEKIILIIDSEKGERSGIEDLQKAAWQLLSATKKEIIPTISNYSKRVPYNVGVHPLFVQQQPQYQSAPLIPAGIPMQVAHVPTPQHPLPSQMQSQQQLQQTALERVQAHFNAVPPPQHQAPVQQIQPVPQQYHPQQQYARWGGSRNVSPSRFRPSSMQLRFS